MNRAPDAGPAGGLVVDKPAGMTSHDVVALARRALGIRRIGHTGTLDPAATGVLVLLLGRATRLAQFMTSHDKEYEAVIRLGWATTTYDAEGAPVGPVVETLPETGAVGTALERFRGEFLQTPPPVSAKKVQGRRAYALARANQPVALRPVRVEVHALALTGREGPRLTVTVACSGGFYVRALAHDLGQALGTGAHLESLRRLRSGPFDLTRAVPAGELAANPAGALGRLVPPAALLPDLPAVHLTGPGARRAAHGAAVGPGDLRDPGLPQAGVQVRLLDPDGALVAVAEARPPTLHPLAVLR